MEYMIFMHPESNSVMCLMSLSACIWDPVFSVTLLSEVSEHFYLLNS